MKKKNTRYPDLEIRSVGINYWKGVKIPLPKCPAGVGASKVVRTILQLSILRKVGPEVLLLVLLSYSQEKLARLDRKDFLSALQGWWKDVAHPQALTTIASQCFATHDVGVPVPAALQVGSGQDIQPPTPVVFGMKSSSSMTLQRAKISRKGNTIRCTVHRRGRG